MNGSKRAFLIGAFVFLSCFTVFSQAIALGDEPTAPVPPEKPLGAPAFGFGINIGTDVLPVPGSLTGETEAYTRLGFKPDIAIGKFGIGLDLTVRMQLKFGQGSTPKIYGPDWIPDFEGNGSTIFDVYLPKFLYIRYGKRGEDPAYVKLGSIDDLTLGNGFIVGNYANTLFLPAQRVFGLQAGLDGNLFGFPYVGIEAITGNLAQLDVVGGRLFFRPLAWMDTPIIKDLQIGGTLVVDRNVNAWNPSNAVVSPETLYLYGIDFIEPILPDPFSLAVFGDVAFQPKQRFGSMLGAGGKLFSFITYGAQIRFMSPGFIPTYFDSNYDRFRTDKYITMQNDPEGNGIVGWYASSGFSTLEDKLKLLIAADGPFKDPPAVLPADPNIADYPHLRGTFKVEDGMVAGFGLEAKYEKYFLGAEGDFWGDLVSPQNAVIGARISYTMGTAVLFLVYDIKYKPGVGYEITSSLQADLKF